MLYNFIAIEGNIGAGKTTLSKMLSRDFNSRLILEQFADNPFLPFFYKNPDRYAFTVELFFMAERHKQLQENLHSQNLFQNKVISDYYFFKTVLFARKTLNGEEFRLFQRIFNILNSTFRKPDLLVYLHRSVDDLLKNIEQRGRDYEKTISAEYLQNIQDSYFDFFKSNPNIPILVIDVTDVDFISDNPAYEKIKSFIQKKYTKGVSRKVLKTVMQ